MQDEAVHDIDSPEVSEGSDNATSSDEASGDDADDPEDEEPLPWERMLDEPLEQVFTLDNDEDVDLYMY